MNIADLILYIITTSVAGLIRFSQTWLHKGDIFILRGDGVWSWQHQDRTNAALPLRQS